MFGAGGNQGNAFWGGGGSGSNPFNNPTSTQGNVTAGNTAVFGQTSNPMFGGGSQTQNPQPSTTTPSLFGRPTPSTQPASSTPSVFGQPSQNTQPSSMTSSVFGQPGQTQPSSMTSSVFGQPSQNTQPSSMTSSVFGQPGQNTQPSSMTSSVFGQPGQNTQPSAMTSSVFGQPSQTQPSSMTSSVFGQPSQNTQPSSMTSSVFGQPSQNTQPTSMTSVFGQPSQNTQPSSMTSSVFGQPSQNTQPSSMTSSVFGQTSQNTQPTSMTSVFGQPSQNTQPSSMTSSVFGKPTNTGTGPFSTTTSSPFGGSGGSTTSPFGSIPVTTSEGTKKLASGHPFSTVPAQEGNPLVRSASGAGTTKSPFGGGIGGAAHASASPFGATGTFGTGTGTAASKPFGSGTTAASKPFGSGSATNTLTSGQTLGSSFGAVPPGGGNSSRSNTPTPKSGIFGGAKPAFGAFGDGAKASPGDVFGKQKREPLVGGQVSSLASSTTSVFSSTGTVTTPSVLGGGAAVKPTSTANVFGAASKTLFTGTQTHSAHTTGSSATAPSPGLQPFIVQHQPSSSPSPSSASVLFGKIVTSAPESTQAVFKSTAAGSTAPTSGKDSGGQGGLFGKPAGTTTSSSSNVFKPKTSASEGESVGGSSSKLESQESKSDHGLFGKAQNIGGGSEQAASENLFGKADEKPKPQTTGLFGKGDQAKEEETGPGRKKIIQRRGVKPDAEARRTGGIFGRALAGATGRSDVNLPRVGRSSEERGRAEREPRASASKTSPPVVGRQTSRGGRGGLDDLSHHTVLAAKNIPPSHNNKIALKKHFSQFGTVSKVFSTPAKNQAVLHFADHESALNAKKGGRVVKPGVPPINLFWKSLSSTKSSGFSPEESRTSRGNRERESSSSGRQKKLFSEVNEELASMSGQSDAFGVSMRTLDRPGGHRSDPLAGALSSSPPKPSAGLFKGTGGAVKHDAAVERTREGARDKARSVSPVNLPIRRNREPAADGKTSKPRGRDDSPVPTSTAAKLVSLKSLIGKICTTVEERLEVLEARDRALREARAVLNAGKDMTTAGAIKGTCRDMCPEKERYLRQERRRLTIYEIHPESDGRGLVDHARAVKEYSRSSADQDMPLSNELRPSEVLARTMTFILNNIIELGGEGKWSEWFEYIWSRTRSIRKDITQQQLCDLTSVALVEQCARFHIFCAERLCEEDPAVFDIKINDENLTKCLQTLKEMYTDMWIKHGQRCPNEAEFRAYVVLMNLNEGDILRETQQLRNEIRGSAPVKFALSVHSALNSDNYIRFFKLVRQAGFLDACILHRYFNQMRSRALLTFIMAYAIPGNTAQMPVDDLLRLLAFEGREEVIRFCEHYGLLSEDGMVAIARQTFCNPESAFMISRAKLLIESGMTVSAGEVINGAPLPPDEILPPTDSFDEEGRFQPDAATLALAREQEEESRQAVAPGGAAPLPHSMVDFSSSRPPSTFGSSGESVGPSTTTAVVAAAAPPKHPYSNDAVKEVAKEIFLDVIKEVCTEMSENCFQSCKAFLNLDAPLSEGFLTEQAPLLIREIAEEVISDERTKVEQDARARAEFAAMKDRAITEIQGEILEEVVNKTILKVANDEKREVEEELKQESVERCSRDIINELLTSYTETSGEELCEDYFTHEVEHKRDMLDRSAAATKRLRQRRFFTRWKNELAGRQRLQRSMLAFPAAPSMFPPRQALQRSLPGNRGYSAERNAVHLGQNAWLTLTPPNEIVENEQKLIDEILRQNEEQKRKEMISRTPLSLCDVTSQTLVDHFKREATRITSGIRVNLYWKMALCLPQVTCEDQYHYNEWLSNKLSTPLDTLPPEFHHPLARVIGCSSGDWHALSHHTVGINVSVRLVDGTLLPSDVALVKRERHLQATQGILFVLGEHGSQDPEFWDREKRRLDRILELVDNKSVSVLIAGPAQLIPTTKSTLVPLLTDRVKFIHALPFCQDVIDPKATQEVQTAVELLVSRATTRVPVMSDWISDYLQHGLERFYYCKVQHYSVYSGSDPANTLELEPLQLVELYNAAICHLASVVGDKELKKVTWPPPEFTHTNPDLPEGAWNNSDVLEYVEELVVSLKLPITNIPTVREEDTWRSACATVWQYVETVAAESTGTDVFLISRVRQVLRKAGEMFQDQCYWRTGIEDAEPTVYNVPWNKIIHICIDHKLACLDRLPPEADLEQLDYTEIRVHYDPAMLEDFMPPDDWLDSTRHVPESSILERSIRRAVKRKQELDDSRLEESTHAHKSSRQSSPESASFCLSLDPTDAKLLEVEHMTHSLLSLISHEKTVNNEYEKYLEEILRDGEKPLEPFTITSHSPFL